MTFCARMDFVFLLHHYRLRRVSATHTTKSLNLIEKSLTHVFVFMATIVYKNGFQLSNVILYYIADVILRCGQKLAY